VLRFVAIFASELLPSTAADDVALVGLVCDLVNRAYEAAEAGLWREGYARTTPAETAAAIASGQVCVARVDGHVEAALQFRALDRETGWFGVLAVDPGSAGRGLASELVRFAEQHAATNGLSTMQLELLVPRPGPHPHTQRLAAWYSRLGYCEVDRRDLADVEPAAVEFLATPCDVVVYRKGLAS
jgi:GNAT superfamily N-acetyltransferase